MLNGIKSITKRCLKLLLNRNNTPRVSDIYMCMEEARKAWLKIMARADFSSGFITNTSENLVDLPDLSPLLKYEHLRECYVLPDRQFMLSRMIKGGIIAEVGVDSGRFSKYILDICKPSKLHLIDLNLQKHTIHEKFKSEIDSGIVKLHEGDSSTILNTFTKSYFDFIYIDADHSYEGVKRDIKAAKGKIKKNGYLIFNDYTYWSPAECMTYGVIRAVNEFCISENWSMKYLALGHYMYCDVAIKKDYS